MYVQQICRKRAAVRDDGGIQWLLLAKWLNCADNERTTATTMTTLTPTTNVRYHNNNNNGDNDGRQFVCNTVSVCFFSFSFFFHILLIRIEDKLCTSQRFSCLACTRLSFSTTSATITTGAEYKKKNVYTNHDDDDDNDDDDNNNNTDIYSCWLPTQKEELQSKRRHRVLVIE